MSEHRERELANEWLAQLHDERHAPRVETRRLSAKVDELQARLTAAEGAASMSIGLRREIADALGIRGMAAGDEELRAGLAKIHALQRVAKAARAVLSWQRNGTCDDLAEALHALDRVGK
jgi:hypothetical protein